MKGQEVTFTKNGVVNYLIVINPKNSDFSESYTGPLRNLPMHTMAASLRCLTKSYGPGNQGDLEFSLLKTDNFSHPV